MNRTLSQIEKSLFRSSRPVTTERPWQCRRSGDRFGPHALSNQAMQRMLFAKVIQAKLTVSTPGDEYEQEADRVAETVMRMGEAGSVSVREFPGARNVQRKCRGCEEEDQILQAKAMPGYRVSETTQVQSQLDGRRDGGRPLSESEREFFEPRFGQNFTQVRLHTDARAAESADSLKARAYTIGRDIVFGAGKYAPSTPKGRQLIAHELTHVLQQRGGAVQIQRDQDEPGTSRFEEHVESISSSSGAPGVWEGIVRRTEFDRQNQLISEGRVPLTYNENACQVTVPLRVSFRQPTLADLTQCPPQLGQPAPSTLPAPLDSASLSSLGAKYVRTVNQRLNGWYSVRLQGCESNHCHGRDIPIRVEVTEVPAGDPRADYDVAPVNMEGRSCVTSARARKLVLLYARDLSEHTMAHEGGHMTLGVGDEYEETAAGVTRSRARVRDRDWSLMNDQHAFGNWSLLHERHFAFVPAFLNRVRPGCQAHLQELSRPTDLNLGVSLDVGYANYAGGSGLTVGLGLDLGLPLNRLREWQALVGIHGRLISNLQATQRTAFLLGMRLGLEGTVTPSRGGFRFGVFGELGVGSFNRGLGRGAGGSQSGTYAEGGVSAGYAFGPESHLLPFIGAELAAGTRLDTSDPQTERWWRAGLAIGLRFH